MDYFDRLEQMGEYIIQKGRVSTKTLAQVFNVSEQTIRKNLKLLEKQHPIKRIHGGAESAIGFNDRMIIHPEEKKHLSQIASGFIEMGDIIYIDSGTSYYYLMDYVPKHLNVTVVTSSLPIAERIIAKSNHDVYLLGGFINRKNFETFSTNIENEINTLAFNKAFLGVSGFTIESAFTEENYYAVELKQAIQKRASCSIVVASSDKEGKISLKKSFDFTDIDVMITEKEVSDEFQNYVKDKLKLLTV